MERDEATPPLRLHLFGPLQLWSGTTELTVGPPQRRAVLALLALADGQPVARDEIVDALWPHQPPAGAANNIQTQIKHLRRLLEPDRPTRTPARLLTSVGTGYRLDVDSFDVDLRRYRHLHAQARTAHARSDLTQVWEITGQVNDLWQPPLAGVPWLAEHPRIAALTAEAELLLTWRVDAAIALGRADQVLARVKEHACRRPLDEHAQANLVRCHVAMGRRADAFAVFDDARRRLVAELGVDAGPVLAAAHRELLHPGPDDDETTPGTAPPAALAQLPADMCGFTGRTEQLRWLDALPHAGAGPTVATISGTAGVGKTALALHWARTVTDRYPDGQLYADLRGFDSTLRPAQPDDVLRIFLTAFGIAPERIPAESDAQTGLYRSVLAGRRVLILLDNARRADQVRPLLPGSTGCLVLITSRNELSGLVADGARPLDLGLMSDAEARQLLTGRIGHQRIAAAGDAVGQLVTACARLPLALAIIAARASTHPQLPLAALSSRLRETSGDLTAFSDDDDKFDLRTVLSWSYRILSPEAATLFRLLGLHPGPDISMTAASALAATEPSLTGRLLTELVRANLLVELQPGRFSRHDLLHAYAVELVTAVEPETVRRAATRRILDYYLSTVTTADQRVVLCLHAAAGAPPQPQDGTETASPAGTGSALAWSTAEYRNMLALIGYATPPTASADAQRTCLARDLVPRPPIEVLPGRQSA